MCTSPGGTRWCSGRTESSISTGHTGGGHADGGRSGAPAPFPGPGEHPPDTPVSGPGPEYPPGEGAYQRIQHHPGPEHGGAASAGKGSGRLDTLNLHPSFRNFCTLKSGPHPGVRGHRIGQIHHHRRHGGGNQPDEAGARGDPRRPLWSTGSCHEKRSWSSGNWAPTW